MKPLDDKIKKEKKKKRGGRGLHIHCLQSGYEFCNSANRTTIKQRSPNPPCHARLPDGGEEGKEGWTLPTQALGHEIMV